MGVHSDPTGSSRMANNAKNLRGQLGLRSSALAPTSSKLTTQYMVMDHMKNHYSKITNAKPAIDNKAPKSISTSQKVRDKNTREGKRRPVSAMSVNYPVRPYSAMTGHDDDIYDEDQWGDVDPDDEVEKQVREIMRMKLQTKSANQMRSTNATYGGSPYYSSRLDHTGHPRPVSARSSARSVHSARYSMGGTAMPTKTISQKTYDGDVIDKHNHVFTQPEKPFTPRLLKSNRVSRIAQSKYYTAPPQKRETNESTNAKEVETTSSHPKPKAKPRKNAPLDKSGEMTDTLMFESLQSRDFSRYSDEREQVVPRLDISLDKDNMNWIKEQAMKAEIRSKSGNLRTGMSRINEDQMLDSTDLEQTGNMTLTGGSLNKTTRSFGTKTLHSSQRLNTDIQPRRRHSPVH